MTKVYKNVIYNVTTSVQIELVAVSKNNLVIELY